MKYPSVSFVIATYNSEKTLIECLASIKMQEYPNSLIEIILADGGSKDKTSTIGKTYKVKFVRVRSDKQGAEYNRAVGVHEAKNDILVLLDHDNVLPHQHWLKKMIRPFMAHKDLVGVETLHYAYDKKEALLGRYFSLFGVNDVVPFYLGKADRLSYLYNDPRQYGVFKKGKVIKKDAYFLVQFTKNNIPTLGSNGFLIKRKLLLKEAKSDIDHFFHIDVNVDLIKKGYNRYAFVDDTIVHRTNERGIIDYLRRRKLFMVKYGFVDISKRRYSVYEKKDFYKLVWFIIIAVTCIKPLYDAAKGFNKIHDPAWFLHPIICFGTVIIYGLAIIEYKMKKIYA